MRTSTIISSAAALAGLASATPSAVITIEASHGGAGSGLTNNTITVPIGPVYTNAQSLSTVSTLYLTGASEVDIKSISCTPYQSTNGTGSRGLAFSSGTPSYLSTNTVQIGSIICLSNATGSASSGNGTSSGGNGTASAGNSTANATSTLLVTPTPTVAPSSTSSPDTSGGMSAANVPYYMSFLLVGTAGVMFSL